MLQPVRLQFVKSAAVRSVFSKIAPKPSTSQCTAARQRSMQKTLSTQPDNTQNTARHHSEYSQTPLRIQPDNTQITARHHSEYSQTPLRIQPDTTQNTARPHSEYSQTPLRIQPDTTQNTARHHSEYSQTPLRIQPDTNQHTHIPRKLAPRRSSPARQAPVISLPLRSAGPSLHPLSHPLATHCPKSYLAPERSVLLHVALCKQHVRGEAHKHRIWM